MKNIYLLSSFFFIFSGFSSFAQEKKADVKDSTNSSSNYDEYSYLWEDDKAKAKAEKKRLKELKKGQKLMAKQKSTVIVDSLKQIKLLVNGTDTVKVDSNVERESYIQDTIKVTPSPRTVLSDTIPDPIPVPVDTLKPQIPVDTLIVPQEELIPFEQEIEKKKKDKNKKEHDAKDIQDFRAGLAAVKTPNTIKGGFTFTQIDDQYFAGLTLSPEFNLGKIGFGLNIPILYGLEDKEFRTDIFKDGIGIGRLITYARYGTQKKDPVYVKLGELNNIMIGFGGLVNNYSNSISFEKRKVGLHYDANVKGIAGIEGMYSDFDASSLNLFVMRPYVRPLAKTGIPIVRTFELGATFLKDKDQTKRPTSDNTFITNTFTEPGIGAFGIDAGLTLLRIPFIQIDLFANYSKLNVESAVFTDSLNTIVATTDASDALSDGFKNGNGFSAGFNFRFHFILDIFSTDLRIERLTYSEHYLPQFFDTSYELNKDGKILSLANAQKKGGIYGSITGHVLQKVRFGGSLLIPDNVSEESPAVVTLNADLDRIGDKISVHGSYFKGGLADLKDAFTFDERSLAKLRFVYHINKYIAAGLDYYWALARVSDGSFQVTKYVSPYFGVNIQF